MNFRQPLSFLFIFSTVISSYVSAAPENVESVFRKITWLGQGALRMETQGKVILVDVTDYRAESPRADILLVTHSHQDHWSAGRVKNFMAPGGLLITGFESGVAGGVRMQPGDTKTVGAITIEAVPAYNIVKKNNHPKANNWCGFIITIEGVRVYIAGDTERIPEMKNVHADIVFLPLGKVYTMSGPEEAVLAAKDTGASIAVPYHWGLYEGTENDAKQFVTALAGSGVEARILPVTR